MNDFELFLNLGAVVKIKRYDENDLYKFVKLMRSLGFLNEYVNWFVFSGKIIELLNNDGSVIDDKEELLKRLKNAE